MKVFLSILSTFILLTACATEGVKSDRSKTWKANVGFTSTVDKNSIETGESFTLDVKWTLPVTIEKRDVEPELPDLKDFERISDTSHVSNGFFVGEKLHWTYTRSYVLSSKRVGSFVVGPAEIMIEGELFKTEPISIEVSQDNFPEFLKTNKCDKQFWSRYLVGHQFHALSNKYKVSPYEIALGDDYTLRRVAGSDRLWATSNYVDYVSEMPEPLRKRYSHAFASEEKETSNKKSAFNTSVKRDQDCYMKLK